MIIVLLSIGALLVFFNIKAFKKEKTSFNNIFHNTEENMEEFEVGLGELRREFSETILELQKEIQELKRSQGKYDGTDENYEAISYNDITNQNTEENSEELSEEINNIEIESEKIKENEVSINIEEKNTTNNNSVKIDEINKLLAEGLSIEEIGARLSIGKGEVLLIKELYLK